MNQINEALNLWVELTGVHPGQTNFNLASLSIHLSNEELAKSLEYDDSGTTTLFFLDALTDAYLSEVGFSVNELIYEPAKVDKRVKLSRKLYGILRSKELNEFRADFRGKVMKASKTICHGELPASAKEMLEDNNDLAYLRRDAVRAMNELRVFQFLQGDSDSEPPKYTDFIYEFWNINSLIRAACTMPSGVAIALIRDPQQFQCYYVFAIRNGGTVSILTDKPKVPHPHFRYMSRRPDRSFGDRAFRHHFPYGLMDMKISDKGEVYFPPVSDATTLVPYQNISHPMKPIKELNPDEIIWISMMFDLILAKFFKRNYKAKELSYTGDMVVHGDALIGTAEAKALTVTDYPLLDAPVLTVDSVKADAVRKEWARAPTGDNRWLEDMFVDRVSAAGLNLLGAPDVCDKYIDMKTMQIVARKELEFLATTKEREEQNALVSQSELDTTSFGSKEELLADQRWHARYNYAKQVDALTKQFYKENKGKMITWYREEAFMNLQFLLDCIVAGECRAPGISHSGSGFGMQIYNDKNCLAISNIPLNTPSRDRSYHDIDSLFGQTHELAFNNGYVDRHGGRYLCFFDWSPHTYCARFKPTDGRGVAKICGCKLSELPEPLQHYRISRNYGGNSILDRIDPMDWVVKNPWEGADMSVRIYLSKRTYTRLMKGLPMEELCREKTISRGRRPSYVRR